MATTIVGRKIGMTRVYDANGQSVPVTVVEAGPCVVVQKKTEETDGYQAVQVGFGDKRVRTGKKRHWPSKPLAGHFKKANVEPKEVLREFRIDPSEYEVGQEITVAAFTAGERVDVTGTSKGKGFQGVIKRHGFGGGKDTHGSMTHRLPGSIGMSADPSRVIPGMRMPGQMGNETITTRNLEVVEVIEDQNLLLIKGGLPGAKRGIVEIRPTNFKSKKLAKKAE